jgi:hypothetical protein
MFMIAIVISAVFCWPKSWSIENPGIGNPIGPSTIPPSTFGSGLVSSPTPIDTDGNLLITGNVRRGRHFRGDVPYRSPTSFASSLGSSALSSFLRDTAGPEDFQTYSSIYGSQPYYSPTETVTTMMPGRSGIFMPESTRAGARAQQDTRSEAAGIFGLDSMAQEQTLISRSTTAADSDLQGSASQYGPLAQSRLMLESRFPTSMSLSRKGTELLTPAQIGIRERGQTSSAELFREQVQDVVDRTQSSTTVPSPGLHDGLWEKNESIKFPNQEINNESLGPAFEMQSSGQNRDGGAKRNTLTNQGNSPLEQLTPSVDSVSQKNLLLQKGANWSAASREFQTGKGQTSAAAIDRTKGAVSGLKGTSQDLEQSDVLERIRQQLEDLTKSLDAAIERRDGYKDASTDPVATQGEKPLGYQRSVPDSNSQKRNSPLYELNKLSQAEISTEASRIMGPHNSFESLSQSKFNQHMRDAEEHLKAGRYYRAAGCFSMASVYQADSPLALAGRGHALLAAGEYVSSALFLSRALAVSPEYLHVNVDLAAMLGDEGKLAGRIADIEQWSPRDGSSQLQFLLGYVYYRTGQFLRAKQAIDAAYEKTPQSPAVRAMKIALDNI